MTMTVVEYERIKHELDMAKAREAAARQQLVEQSGHTARGSKTLVMDGYKISITNTVNTSIYEASIEDVRQRLGADVFDQAFRVKYDVNAAGFKALTDEQREIAEEAIITKPGTPQLKIVKRPESED